MQHQTPSAGRATGIEALLNPRSVAIIGASEDRAKFGGRALHHLLGQNFAGQVFPINPNRATLLGLPCYPNIGAVAGAVDVALLAVPRDSAVQHIRDCARAGVKSSILITNQFSDESEEGAAQELELVRIAHDAGMRLLGPNCLGLFSPANRVALCSSPVLASDAMVPGAIGLVSQSGAIMATIYDRAKDHGIHFSHCASVGNQADLEICDFAEFFVDDPATRVIYTYVEGIRDGARLREVAARALRAGKPWLMLKAGRTAAGASAAYSHTASMVGDYAVLQAVCRENGIVLMDDLNAMTLLAALLARFPGRSLASAAVIATSGGASALAADCFAHEAVPLTALTPATRHGLSELFSERQGTNPIDLGAGAKLAWSDVAPPTTRLIASDPGVDGVLAVMTTAALLGPTTDKMLDACEAAAKPSLFVVLPGALGEDVRSALLGRSIPFTSSLNEAAKAFRGWLDYSRFARDAQSGTPQRPATAASTAGRAGAESGDPAWLDATLHEYGIATAPLAVCTNTAEAVRAAERIGYPVALKLHSPQLTHKSDAGLVQLELGSAQALRDAADAMAARARESGIDAGTSRLLVQRMVSGAAEMILGIKRDAQFGPMLVVGAGGTLVELIDDVAISSVPLDRECALRLLRQLRIHKVLAGVRGKPPADLESIADAMVGLGWFAHDARDWLQELDLNPVIVGIQGKGCTAVDARILARTPTQGDPQWTSSS
ncbi:MAG: acetate--CoA ligase family protein [Lautropia sp.]